MKPEIITRKTSASAPFTYADLDALQKEIAERVLSQDKPGALLLAEVSPVITLGKRGVGGPILESATPQYETQRGGLATYHGPGQWVLFCVDRLDRLVGDSRGVRTAVEGLLGVAYRAASQAMTEEGRSQLRIDVGDRTGLWIGDQKLASLGVQVSRRVLMHGLAINIHRTPESFLGLPNPCGLDVQIAYLEEYCSNSSLSRLMSQVCDSLIQESLQTFWQNQG